MLKDFYEKKDLELYTDYLMCNFGQATATGLSAMVNGEVSHDHITRFLLENKFSSKDLWLYVKKVIREIENHSDGVLIFDDTIQEKAWTDENEIICWHYDHCSGRTVKGLNILNAVYHCADVSIPVAFEVIKKTISYCNLKTKQEKRTSEVTKNELLREMLLSCIKNDLKFKYILLDSWFTSADNFDFIRSHKKDFIKTE